jgi:hypothetical protein
MTPLIHSQEENNSRIAMYMPENSLVIAKQCHIRRAGHRYPKSEPCSLHPKIRLRVSENHRRC